jgi:RimJ/RimL family protein N-acetyltransferase
VTGDGLRLRPAAPEDWADLLAWRNDPLARAMSRNDEGIDEASHRRWFDRALADPARTLLIAELDGAKIGVVRFDRGEDAEVSINLAPVHRGRGLGEAMLRLALQSTPERLIAHVKDENLASRRLFERCGLRLLDTHDGMRRYERPSVA